MQIVAALHAAAKLVEEPLPRRDLARGEEGVGGAVVTVALPHHGVARVKLPLG